jgi:trans-aconitate 2-methyltransferase
VLGVDGSPAMIEAARKLLDGEPAGLKARVSFELLNVPEFRADRAYTLIFSNATFHWIPDKRALFGSCFDALRPGGRIVVQMPANETETAKMEIGLLARQPPWNTMLGGRDHAFEEEPPEFYAAMLARLGYDRIDCYHLTFHHPMDRPADVVQWYRSTGLRPFLDALPKDRHDEFLAQVTARLNSAYGTCGPMTFDFNDWRAQSVRTRRTRRRGFRRSRCGAGRATPRDDGGDAARRENSSHQRQRARGRGRDRRGAGG